MKTPENKSANDTLITESLMEIQQLLDDNQRGDWEQVAHYVGRYFGEDGNELGKIPVSIAEITSKGENGQETTIGWLVAETPSETTELHSVWTTKEEAQEAAEELAMELDETPFIDELIGRIESTGYFDDDDIIPLIVEAATQYTQGYLLVTPDIDQPVGERWTTNGCLQCPHLRLDATYSTEVEAAEALLNAINSRQGDVKQVPINVNLRQRQKHENCHSPLGAII